MARYVAGAAALLLFSCSSTGSAGSRPEPASAPVLFAPSLSGVDPTSLPDLERVERLIAGGDRAAARRVLERVLARGPSGGTLEAARAFERMLDLDPSFLPALQALARAVESGADREAEAILARLALRRPRGRVKELVDAYRRILDGRGVVSGLRLRLECRPEDVEKPPPSVPEGARIARLFLVAESELQRPIELDPGPATLFVTRSVVGRSGIERDAVETRTFGDLRRLSIQPGERDEIPLALYFLSAAESEIASRLRFELDLRSGSARILPRGGTGTPREVPAMRLRVRDAEETAFEASLGGLPPATPEELAELASDAMADDPAAALALAVRIPPAERDRALDLLGTIVPELPEETVRALVPSLRWIAVTSAPGGDPRAWRAWLREREERKTGERPKLLLPRAIPAE